MDSDGKLSKMDTCHHVDVQRVNNNTETRMVDWIFSSSGLKGLRIMTRAAQRGGDCVIYLCHLSVLVILQNKCCNETEPQL